MEGGNAFCHQKRICEW